MRRKEKEITQRADIEAIIESAAVCRLAMADGERPYVIPLSFGYRDQTLYFHCAPQGRKIDILRKNPRVCFEFDIDMTLVEGATACDWGAHFQSVIGFGTASFVTEPADKKKALDTIMAQYAGSDTVFDYPEAKLRMTTVVKVAIDKMTGKRS